MARTKNTQTPSPKLVRVKLEKKVESPAPSPVPAPPPKKRTFYLYWVADEPHRSTRLHVEHKKPFEDLKSAKEEWQKIKKVKNTIYSWIGDDNATYIPCGEKAIVNKELLVNAEKVK